MNNIHPLLQQQLSRHFQHAGGFAQEMAAFLDDVSTTYHQLTQAGPGSVFAKSNEVSEPATAYTLQTSTVPANDAARLKTHLDNWQRIAKIGSWELDMTLPSNAKHQIVYASTETYRLLGIDPSSGQLEFDGIFNAVHPDDRNLVAAVVTNAQQQQSPYDLDHRVLHPDGTIKMVRARGEITFDTQTGKPLRMVGTLQDITKQKKDELALKVSEYRYRTLVRHAASAVFIINQKAEIIFVSASVAGITGHDPTEITGLSIFDITHPDDNPRLEQFMEELQTKPGQTCTICCRKMHKDGGYIHCEGITTNLLYDPGINGIVVSLRDITMQQQHEAEMLAYTEKLRKANMELDKFVYSASHDLRAPLSSMLGVLGLIEGDVGEGLVMDELQLIKESIAKLDGFILDILDYSRNSRLEVHKEQIDFEGKLQKIITNLTFIDAGETPVSFAIEVQGDTPFFSDTDRLGSILHNVISNSILYRNPDIANPYVAIEVALDAQKAVIAIKDNGLGIAKEYQRKVFEMFFRLSNKSVGSGLGLYIVAETVQKLSGHITLESEPGVGTVVTITVPNLASA